MKLSTLLAGRKTYIMGALAVLWGVFGFFMGYIDQKTATDAIWAGFTALAMRNAIK